MKRTEDQENDGRRWVEKWLESVAAGQSTMSQRKLASVERLGGGLKTARSIAKEKGVHLLVLEDDKGNELVAASIRPFRVVC